MIDFAAERERMVRDQIAGRGMTDAAVLDAMRAVPRERFVAPEDAGSAYADTPLPIGEGQTISQPYMVAVMAAAAGIRPGARVLEVGAGSGYAAAVLSRIAGEVYAIERHPRLAEAAGARLRTLGYGNVIIRQGDGTKGWPGAAPFDAILVAAGATGIPPVLSDQLAIGGTLVIPVGDSSWSQRLLRVRRLAPDRFEEEDIGAVAFVPLVSDQGATDRAIPELLAEALEPLLPLEHGGFADFADRFGTARVVLLGAATHGTAEFYEARARLTAHLIKNHGFTIVAVEADWPDAAAIDADLRDRPRLTAGPAFARFPTWMWRNEEVAAFLRWLRKHNDLSEPKAGFYGLDLYSLGASIRAVIDYLERVDPAAARLARGRYGCLMAWQKDPAAGEVASLHESFGRCETDVLAMLRDLLAKRLDRARQDPETFLDAERNARIVAAAERYYRLMYRGARESWNLRASHMFDTLEALLAARPGAKAVVWAHNTHVGNAEATEIGRSGELSLGQLCRRAFAGDAVLVGMGTDRGTVTAATDWDGEAEEKPVQPAREGSFESMCRATGTPRFLVDFSPHRHAELGRALGDPLLERALGAIYRPDAEWVSHYLDAILPGQFDAWLWFEETVAVTPLPAPPPHGVPDTFPFGL